MAVDISFFNNTELVEERVLQASETDQGSLRTALSYLYFDEGPVNLPRGRQRLAETYLSETEVILLRWLSTRTNGRLRKEYGAKALRAARGARYRCIGCGYADVRALNLDHVNGRVEDTPFHCLCANCHAIKSREKDWTGRSVERKN